MVFKKKRPQLICVQKWHSREQIAYNGPCHFSESSSRNRMLLLFPGSICSTDLTASNSAGSDVQLQSWVRALKWKSPFSSEIQQRSPPCGLMPQDLLESVHRYVTERKNRMEEEGVLWCFSYSSWTKIFRVERWKQKMCSLPSKGSERTQNYLCVCCVMLKNEH